MSIEENKPMVLHILDAHNKNDLEAFAAAFPDGWTENVGHAFGTVTDFYTLTDGSITGVVRE